MPDESNPNVTIEPEETQFVEFNIKIEPPDSHIYSNVASMSMSPWDIRINFADVSMVQNKDESFKANFGVVMAAEHAAGLALLLTRQLRQYEQTFGAIRHPEWQAMKARSKKVIDEMAKAKE